MKIKHISFDLWGTLITSHPEYKQQRTELLEACFGVKIDPAESRRGKILVDYMSEMTGLQVSYPHVLALMLGDKVQNVDKVSFLHSAMLFQEGNLRLMEGFHPQLISEDIIPLLKTISALNINMSVLSNTSVINGKSMRKALNKLGITEYFKFMFFSDESMYAKPNPIVYHWVQQNAQVTRGEILHVGDNPYADSGANVVKSFIITPENPITNLLTLIPNATQNV